MCALNTKFFYSLLTLLVLLTSLSAAESLHSNGRYSRRRPALGSAKATAEEVTEKSDVVADQLALAASHTEKNPHRRGGAYANDGEDYPYGNLEMNLIRPESEPVHTQITAKYTASLSAARPYESGLLEDAETAEEYVANAMKMQRYGTRLREPIRILSTESAVQSPPRTPLQSSEEPTSDRENSAPANVKYEYYNVAQQQQQQQKQQQQQQQASQQLEGNHRALLEAQMRAQLQAQINQAQQQVESQQQQQQLESHTERGQAITAVNADNSAAQQSSPTYSREPSTRAYEVYDDSVNSYEANGDGGGAADGDGVDRHYRTKYIFQPAYPGAGVPQAESEPEQLRVSASTEIPKAEIMKQIEKSVMKYMKELEAEGKIVTSPQEAKPYYKTITVPAEDKHIGSTTLRPNYPSATPAHNSLYVSGDSGSAVSSPAATAHRAPSASNISGYASSARHHAPKHHRKSAQRYQAEAETPYRASAGGHQPHALSESLAPNVEFVYKIKTRAPLQTATVKTISKPYTLPLKGNFEHFDHTAALKNIEDFDLSHVVTTQEPDERPSSLSASVNSKPNKLYFNSEIYHDINSLPYKPEKSRGLSAAAAAAEYRKLKASGELNGDYKGYSGYFAEPAPPAEASDEKETSGSASASAQVSDDGYPLMNPYQYVLKKEPLPSKYEETSASWVEAHAKPVYTALAASQKGLEYDSYSPKFNNNPEGYGYQHSYKAERERERDRDHEREPQHGGHKYTVSRPNGASSKRGKRGGGLPYPNASKKSLRGAAVKDIEASLALRPPPKK